MVAKTTVALIKNLFGKQESSGSSSDVPLSSSGDEQRQIPPWETEIQTVWGTVAGLRLGKAKSEQEAYKFAVERMKRRVPNFNPKAPVSFTYQVGRNRFRGISAIVPEKYQVWHYYKKASYPSTFCKWRSN